MTPAKALSALDIATRSAARDASLNAQRERAGIRAWTRGGCAVYAEGLRRWLGPEAVLIGLREQGETTTEHVAAVWRGLYFDSYGVRDESDFLFDAENIGLFRVPELVAVSDVAALPSINFAPELVPAVTTALFARLDPLAALKSLAALSDQRS